MNESAKIKVVIIGAGNMAREHIKVFSSIGSFSLEGIHSRTRKKAESLARDYQIPYVSESINDLFLTTKADLIIVAVSELSVYSVIQEVFKYPWVSIIEKPVGYNYKNANLIKDYAERQKSQVFVSLNRRFYSSTRHILNEIENENSQRLIQIFDQEEPFLSNKPLEVQKNWMYANSIHLIDFFKILGRGKITSVKPLLNWDPDNPSFVIAKVDYSSGDVGIYSAVWNAPGPWMVAITTSKTRFELRPLESISIQKKGSRKAKTMPIHQWDKDYKPGLRLQAEEILNLFRGNSHKLVSLSESLETMKLINQIYEK